LIININKSIILGVLFAVVHIGAILLAILMPLDWLLKSGIVAALGLALYLVFRRQVLRTAPGSVQRLEVANDGSCAVWLFGATDWEAGRIAARFVSPWLVILSIRCESSRWPLGLVIPADAVEAELFRRLRVTLKQQSAAV
jgi:toxin CptA